MCQTGVSLFTNPSERLVAAARELRSAAGRLRFSKPVVCVYNPLAYAWAAHECYLRKFGAGRKRVVFLGMNPGPFGMVQTGVPFGEVTAVREWLGITAEVGRPGKEHPRRPVNGFSCTRSEVSGQRLWNLFKRRFGTAENFFRDHMVINYCPLSFVEESGRNRTPDKLAQKEKIALFKVCDAHLRETVATLEPEWVIGIGDFAVQRARSLFGNATLTGGILHPSPASPLANRDWGGTAARQLLELGVWES